VPAGGRFEGRLAFRGAARIAGQVVGPVEGSGWLEVLDTGNVVGPVTVDELESAGEIEGDVEARDVARLDPGATLRGTLRAPRLAVANGAVIQGRCSVGDASE
jgi:cytoskeletal protein CcmA (bactofilin family)